MVKRSITAQTAKMVAKLARYRGGIKTRGPKSREDTLLNSNLKQGMHRTSLSTVVLKIVWNEVRICAPDPVDHAAFAAEASTNE
jgi:hypothetical protein